MHSRPITLFTRIPLDVLIEGQTLIPIAIGTHDLVDRAPAPRPPTEQPAATR